MYSKLYYNFTVTLKFAQRFKSPILANLTDFTVKYDQVMFRKITILEIIKKE